jgi:hypothetical protein
VTSSPSFDRRVPPQQAQAAGGGHDHALARQVLGERLARRALALKATTLVVRATALGGEFIFGGRGLQILELQLELVEQRLLRSELAP